MKRTAAALFLAIPFFGCAHMLPGNSEHCPASGGPQWRELRSQHFLLDTDLDSAGAAEWLNRLEKYQAMEVVALTGEARKLPAYVRVIITKDDSTFDGLAGRRVRGANVIGGVFWTGHLLEPEILFSVPSAREDSEIPAHELAHFISFELFPQHSKWFEEGLVHFVQTVAHEKGEYANSAGLVPHDYGYALNSPDRVFAKNLLRMRREGGFQDQFWSWVMFHYLWNNKPKQFEEYQNRLIAGDSAMRAWKTAFPEYDPDKPGALEHLDDELLAHKTNGKFEYFKVEVQLSEVKFTERLLSAAEVHVRMAAASWHKNDLPDQLKKALEDDKTQPEALGWKIDLDEQLLSPAAVAPLSRAQAAHPQDWRAAFYLGMALKGPQRIEMLARAVAIEPQSGISQRELARTLLEAKQPDEALPHAKQAVALVPEDSDSAEVLASVAIQLGDCEAASPMILRATDLLSDEDDDVRERLDKDAKTCAKH